MVQPRYLAWLGLMLGGGAVAGDAYDPLPLNMTEGVTATSREVYGLHMDIFWVCVWIGVVVFGVMAYSIFAHRKSRGAKAATFHESTTVEIIWTAIPFIILIAMAMPAAKVLIDMEDSSNSDMTVKVTGYQWKWEYEYQGLDISFFSSLHPDHNAARKVGGDLDVVYSLPNYLKEVDNPLVLPVGKKIRFLHTSKDVIHSWWVPDLALKKDAIPDFVNTNWALIEEPGIYRGKCAELCGRDHGFMPIVVKAVPQEEFDAWVAEQTGGNSAAGGEDQGDAVEAESEVEPEAEVAEATAEPAAAEAAPEPEAETTEPAAEPEPVVQAAPEVAIDADLLAQGKAVYEQSCAACHQANGAGIPGAFPALTGSAIATGPAVDHIDVVVNGVAGTAMTPFGAMLSDEDIAAVVTYERNALGNSVGDTVQPADVAAQRN